MSPAKPPQPKFPLLDHPQEGIAKKGHPDDWAPALLGHWMGLQPQPEALVEMARGWLDDWKIDLRRLEIGKSSWNWDWMLGAAALFRPDQRDAAKIVDWWIDLLAAQTNQKPGTGFLSRFEGSEPRSSTYTAWRVGSLLAVLSWASKQRPATPLGNQAKALVVLGRRWLEIWCFLQALGMVPWPDKKGYAKDPNKPGLWWNGPTPSPVGERSTLAFEPDPPVLWALLSGWQAQIPGRTTWPVLLWQQRRAGPLITDDTAAILRRYVREGGGLDDVLAKLDGVSVDGTFNFIRMPEGLLVYRERRNNNNSPTHLYSWAPSASQVMELGCPDRRRGKGAPGGGGAFLHPEPPATPERIICNIGPKTTETALPSWRPQSHVVADDRGVRQI